MKMIKFFVACLLFVNILEAQSKNIFWKRDFWKTKPSIELVEQKITEGNSPTILNKHGFDAVVYAILEKAPNKTIKHLLDKKGNNVNKLTHDKRTYVFWAAYKNNVDLMKYLIAKKAKMNLRDSHRFSVLTFAAAAGVQNRAIYDLCIENGIDIKTDIDEHGANALLLIAPSLNDTKLLDYLVSKGIAFNSVDANGNGIFDYAAKKGNKTMMQKLISLGALFKVPTTDGANAMIFASRGTRSNTNSLETFKYLESLGISPNSITKQGFTPLHALSFKNKDVSIFEYFIEKGVDVNQQDENGNTAFLNAVYRNDLKVVKYLSQYITDINTRNKDGKSALMIALSKNSVETVEFLIEKGANINHKDEKGNTLSYYLLDAFKAENQDVFNKKRAALESVGFHIPDTQAGANTLYHLAVQKNDLELLKKLTVYEIPVNAKNDEGITALHLAAMKAKDAGILKFLIAQGADKTIETNFDETVFSLATENELLQKTNIDFLLNH